MGEGKRILINGAGTVGNRGADVLLSMGVPVFMCKYDADKDDIKTKELKMLLNRYKDSNVGDIPVYAARGSDLEQRIDNIKQHVGRCDGSIDNLPFNDVALAIDCTPGMDIRNHLDIYAPNDIPFAINGGGDDKLIERLYWASVPNTLTHNSPNKYKKRNAKIVSCNTHAVTTALSILKGSIENFEERLRDKIYIDFARRHDDPHKGKERPLFVTTQRKQYHTDEVYYLVPEVNCELDTTVSKWPTEYFHNITMIIDLKDEVTGKDLDKTRLAFQTYPRAILEEYELGHERTKTAAEWSHIKDADIPFPVYMVNRAGDYKIVINGLTPQRGIVAASTADYVLWRTNWFKDLKTIGDVFNYTNSNAKYRNESFQHIKGGIQDNLAKFDEYSLERAKK